MISEKMHQELCAQMTREIHASYLYLAMASWFEYEGFEGMAAWMSAQSSEEHGHAKKFYDYINEQRMHAEWGALEKPKATWKDPMEAFKDAFAHEQKVTGHIHDLVKLAREENDYATEAFLQWFVTEQVEEESSVDYIVGRLEQVGDFRPGLFFLDRELAARGGA